VTGLQRGFKIAGVKYVMMSLWPVPDKETAEFMETFYSYWDEGIREAFHKTQQFMANKYRNEPYKWAGFVLVE
jgi:CHAT domain-containing protein